MAKYGRGYQVEGIRRKAVMEKSDTPKTIEKRCKYESSGRCMKESYPFMADLQKEAKRIHMRRKELKCASRHICYKFKCPFMKDIEKR